MSAKTKGIATIVPVSVDGASGLTRTTGTKVMVDGVELKGVTKVVLTAEPNDVWRASIDCMVNVDKVPGALVVLECGEHIAWWRRVLMKLAGVAFNNSLILCVSSHLCMA